MLDSAERQRRQIISREMVAYAIENLFFPWLPLLSGARGLIRRGRGHVLEGG